ANIGRALSNFDEKIDFDNFEAVKQMKKLRKDWHNADNGRIKIDAAIHAEYTSSRSLWQPLGEYAYINNMVLQVHLSETKREHEACIEKYGKTPTQLFNDEGVFRAKTIAAHCVWLTDDDIDILNENGVSVAHNPVSNLKLASGVARIPLMLRRGVNVTLGTDGVASNNNFDMFEELKLSAILHKGIEHDPKTVPAAQALALATVNGARAQGRAGECGELRVGLDADIVMIDMARVNLVPCHNVVSNLVYSARGADVCMTMVRGNILYENGAFTTIDIERVKDEIERYAIPHMFS
ncbi:MAG: amidohydrolase family protein, partial [Clostridia bacterium]